MMTSHTEPMTHEAQEQMTPKSNWRGMTLRDKSMGYSVRYLFGNRFEVEGNGNGRRYYPECVYIGGDFIARCTCPDKTINKAVACKHETAVVRFERNRVAQAQGF